MDMHQFLKEEREEEQQQRRRDMFEKVALACIDPANWALWSDEVIAGYAERILAAADKFSEGKE